MRDAVPAASWWRLGDPLLAALLVPSPCEPLGRVVGVGGGDVDVAGGAGSAHGHVGEFSSAAVVEDVGDVHGGALAAVGGDGVPVAEALGADVVGSHGELLAVGGDRGQLLGVRVHGGDVGGLGGDPGAVGSGGQGDDPVAGPVAPPAGGGQLRPRQQPGSFPQAAGGLVEGLDVARGGRPA